MEYFENKENLDCSPDPSFTKAPMPEAVKQVYDFIKNLKDETIEDILFNLLIDNRFDIVKIFKLYDRKIRQSLAIQRHRLSSMSYGVNTAMSNLRSIKNKKTQDFLESEEAQNLTYQILKGGVFYGSQYHKNAFERLKQLGFTPRPDEMSPDEICLYENRKR